MSDQIAVIDLGTNTFHLLVIEINEHGQQRPILRHKEFVHLGANGLDHLSDAAFGRGLKALQTFKEKIDSIGIAASKVYAIGTAALRRADNGAAFIQQVAQETGIQIKRISGHTEARLIHSGVKQTIRLKDTNYIIMDIGGGSVEFIITDHQQIFWQQSFPIGATILKNTFHKNDPITNEELAELEDYFEAMLPPLLEATSNYELGALVGASGSFDVLRALIATKKNIAVEQTSCTIELADFYEIYDLLLSSNYEERLAIPDMPPNRAKLIVVAMVLIRWVLERLYLTDLYQSDYAMKEGIISEVMEGKEIVGEVL